ncbi:hypothetical protein ACJZ2D_011928 [Fusarium nematophilum]
MEVLGAVASAVALMEAGSKATRLAARAAFYLKDAPVELAGLRDKITALEAQLALITSVHIDTPLPVLVLTSFEEGLTAVENAIRVVLDKITVADQKSSGFRRNVRWALLTRRTVLDLEDRVHQAQQSMIFQLALMNLHFHKNYKHVQDETSRFQSEARLAFAQIWHLEKLLGSPGVSHTVFAHDQEKLLKSTEHLPKSSKRAPPLWGRSITTKSQLGAWLLFLGIQGIVLRKRSTNNSMTCISIKFRLPPLWGFLGKMIVADFVTQRSTFYRIPRFKTRSFNIVPEDADIMEACKQGNVAGVRRLLEQRRASAFDITPSNYSPLYYAILSGSVELVRLLLDQHIDLANCPFGKSNTDSFLLDFEVQDLSGFTVLQHVAAQGSGSIARALLRLGAALPARWYDSGSPIINAISRDNLSTFEALTYHYPDGGRELEQEDEAGYTMLGYAAYLGSDAIVRNLLKRRAKHVMFECNSTPELGGPGLPYMQYTRYMQALEDYGRIVIREDTLDSVGEMDIYWDANEKNEWVEAW